jgi:hypothetical protein
MFRGYDGNDKELIKMGIDRARASLCLHDFDDERDDNDWEGVEITPLNGNAYEITTSNNRVHTIRDSYHGVAMALELLANMHTDEPSLFCIECARSCAERLYRSALWCGRGE